MLRKKTRRQRRISPTTGEEDSEEDWSEGSSSSSEAEYQDNSQAQFEARRQKKRQIALQKYQYQNIFDEWWKVLPEITAGGTVPVDDIYLVASFNHWFPVRMDAWEKKMVLLTSSEEIEQ